MDVARSRPLRATMDISRVLLAVIATAITVLGCGAAHPGEKPVGAPAKSTEALSREVLRLSDQYTDAYRLGDWAAADSLLADDYFGASVGLAWTRDSLK